MNNIKLEWSHRRGLSLPTRMTTQGLKKEKVNNLSPLITQREVNSLKRGKINILPAVSELADFSVVPPTSNIISQAENNIIKPMV